MKFEERRSEAKAYQYDRRKISARGRRHSEPGTGSGNEDWSWDQEIAVLDHLIDQEKLSLEAAKRPDKQVEHVASLVMEQIYMPDVVNVTAQIDDMTVKNKWDDVLAEGKIIKRQASAVFGLALAQKLEQETRKLFSRVGGDNILVSLDEELEKVNSETTHDELERLADNVRYWWMQALTEYLDATSDLASPRYKRSSRYDTVLPDAVDRFEFLVKQRPDFDVERAGLPELRKQLTTMLSATTISLDAVGIDDLFAVNLERSAEQYKQALELLARAEARVALQRKPV